MSGKKLYDPPITLWSINSLDEIYPIEVVAESASAIWIKPHTSVNWRGDSIPPRLAYKKSLLSFHKYEEAKAALLHRLQRRVDMRRISLQAAEGQYEEAKTLKPPAPQANG